MVICVLGNFTIGCEREVVIQPCWQFKDAGVDWAGLDWTGLG